MPINTFNDAATTTISGSLVVAKDPRTGDAGSLTVASGLTLTAGNLAVSAGNLAVTGQLTATEIGGGVVTQTIATSPANTITASARVAYITGAGIATCALASGVVAGQDLTIFNAGAASTVVSTAGYAYANITLASLACQSFYWDAASTLWYHKA